MPFFFLRFAGSGFGSNYLLGWLEGKKANGTASAVEATVELGTNSDAVSSSVPADATAVDVPAVDSVAVVVPASGGAVDFVQKQE